MATDKEAPGYKVSITISSHDDKGQLVDDVSANWRGNTQGEADLMVVELVDAVEERIKSALKAGNVPRKR